MEDNEDTEECARGLVILLCNNPKSKEKTRALIEDYPAILKAQYFCGSRGGFLE